MWKTTPETDLVVIETVRPVKNTLREYTSSTQETSTFVKFNKSSWRRTHSPPGIIRQVKQEIILPAELQDRLVTRRRTSGGNEESLCSIQFKDL